MDTKEILALDKTEHIVVQTRKHPVGLLMTYVATGFSIVVMLVLLFFALSSDLLGLEIPDVMLIIVFSLAILVIGLVGYVSAYVYKQNELVVTNENIIQVLQFGLFNRQTSQLSLAKIQDVSVDQAGIIPSWFNYGTIEIETAGEKSNFRFSFAPNPNKVAKMIIEAHEAYVRGQQSIAGHHDV